jgi:hypothetical protein
LQTGIQRQRDDIGIFHGGHRLIGRMRRKDWHRLAQPRHPNGFCLSRILGRHMTLFDHAIENPVTRGASDVGVAIKPAVFRRLRQRHQQRRFRQRQPLRLLAEISDRGRAHALEIAAERRQRQIEVENLSFCQLPLNFECADHLAQLGVNRAFAPRLHQSSQLHRDGRAAGNNVTAGNELKRGAAQCQGIDARMGIKTPVLIRQQQFEVARIDIVPGIDRQPPAAVGHRVGTQQFAIAVDDGGGDLPGLRERQWTQRDNPRREDADDGQNGKGNADKDAARASLTNTVMAGLVPAIHVFPVRGSKSRGCPGHLARRRRFAPFARA